MGAAKNPFPFKAGRFGINESLEEFQSRLMEIERLRTKLVAGKADDADIERLSALEGLDEDDWGDDGCDEDEWDDGDDEIAAPRLS